MAAIASVGLLGTLGTGDGLLGERQGAEAQSVGSPNFVFVMADDLDESSMEKLGGIRQVMGSNGTTFQNAYVTYSLCCSSRATILRGQYPHNHGIHGNAWPLGGALEFRRLSRDQSTTATWLDNEDATSGPKYQTKLIAKYMNSYFGSYVPPGWDEWYALKQGTGPYGEVKEVNENGQWTTFEGHSPTCSPIRPATSS